MWRHLCCDCRQLHSLDGWQNEINYSGTVKLDQCRQLNIMTPRWTRHSSADFCHMTYGVWHNIRLLCERSRDQISPSVWNDYRSKTSLITEVFAMKYELKCCSTDIERRCNTKDIAPLVRPLILGNCSVCGQHICDMQQWAEYLAEYQLSCWVILNGKGESLWYQLTCWLTQVGWLGLQMPSARYAHQVCHEIFPLSIDALTIPLISETQDQLREWRLLRSSFN